MASLAQVAQELPPGMDPMEFLLGMPALQPAPPGADLTMTTDGPDQVWYLVVAITCIAIPGLFLLIRMYTKLAIVRMLEPADFFLILAFPLIIVEVVMGYNMIKWGAGVHQWQVTLRQLFKQLYWMNTAEVVYCPLSFLVKMAILLQYLRLFAPSRQLNQVMWYGAWSTAAACFCFYTIFMFWTLFYCTPRQKIWNTFVEGKCHDHGAIVISQGVFNMASDIVILLLPTRTLWQLQVPLARKIVITLLFATGLLACAATVMRIVATRKIWPYNAMSDVSHNGLFIGLWTEAEVALGFIVACSLSLPRLIQAKRQAFSRAFAFVSSPFSSTRGTVRSSSRKSTLRSKSTQATSRSSQCVDIVEVKQPVHFEERELHDSHERGNQPIRQEHSEHPLPSTAESSRYSPSLNRQSSNASSVESNSNDSLRVAPLRWSKPGRYYSQEVIHPYQIPEDREVTTFPMPPTFGVQDSSITQRSMEVPAINYTPPSERSHRLTADDLFEFQQFRFHN